MTYCEDVGDAVACLVSLRRGERSAVPASLQTAIDMQQTYAIETPTTRESPEVLLAKSLAIALPDGRSAEQPRLASSCNRELTRRGVMWIGQTCNLRCYFCYYLDRIEDKAHPEHAFMSLDKAKDVCRTLVEVYGNNAIDIQGGEPTIWKDIHHLIRYCNDIGLHPTLITNGVALAKRERAAAFKESGVRDFLVSVQGLGPVYDDIVGMQDGWIRQMEGLRNMVELQIPIRFNCVLSKPVVEQLPQVAELAIKTGAYVVNFLTYNPVEDQGQGDKRSIDNVARISELSGPLGEALDTLEAAGVEANVRYAPMCAVEPQHRKSVHTFHQLSYDSHEWDFASWSWSGRQPQRMAAGPLDPPSVLRPQLLMGSLRQSARKMAHVRGLKGLMRAGHRVTERMLSLLMSEKTHVYSNNAQMRAQDDGYRQVPACKSCDLRSICCGVHGDYTQMFGSDEVIAVDEGGLVDDPNYYTRHQRKYVEREDEAWLLGDEPERRAVNEALP